MMSKGVCLFFLLGWLAASVEAATECRKRFYGEDSFVCVCDVAGGCDQIDPIGDLSEDRVAVYSTSASADRLKRTVLYFDDTKLGRDVQATVDTSVKKQTVLGIGGAITDSVVTIRNQLRGKLQDLLHSQYYGPNSSDYRIARVPLGSCDFSLSQYSFDDTPDDFHIDHFVLDDMKADYLKQVVQDVPDIKLYASSWSAPAWMKDSGRMQGPGQLLGAFNGIYYLAYARYLVKFFEEYYKQHSIEFWGMTVQNEPHTGAIPNWLIQTMFLSPEMQRDFVNLRLGPLLRDNWITKNLTIMANDDFRNVTMDAALKIYNIEGDDTAVPGNFVDGLAVHWYEQKTPFSVLTDVHNLRPDKFVLATEACNSFLPFEQVPYYGRWKSGDLYAHDILQNLRNWVVGWVSFAYGSRPILYVLTDWNIWLDTIGGPNWAGNFVDSAILVNTTGDGEFYKQPMYYAIAHFSHFIPPGSTIVDFHIDQFDEDDVLEGVAAVTPDQRVVLVLLNRDPEQTFKLEIDDQKHAGTVLRVTMPPASIKTLVWELN
ncbi:Glucosylceramidase [Aphelenchoides fujianensis]|nr:Glucosylceramidase [Aphelenchoides fujianensis]